MNNAWNDSDAGKTELHNLVHLSNLIGADLSLVQPGGGNTSVKLEERDLLGASVQALAVKGSGTDLRTIAATGFTHLYVGRLAILREREAMSDEEMMRLMQACMLFPDRDPVPSVETPLHSLLPYRFIAHTHDVATLSLTDTPGAQEHVERVYGGTAAFLAYVRPGFPLARRVAEMFGGGAAPPSTIGLVMEKHGLTVWGETAKECYGNLVTAISKAEEYVSERTAGKRSFGQAAGKAPDITTRRALAAQVLPVIRGELGRSGFPCVLHFDDPPETLEAIAGRRFGEIASRGVMTPEHILRAGVWPLVVAPEVSPATGAEQRTRDASASAPAGVARQIRDALQKFRKAYAAYADAQGQTRPIPDSLKTIVIQDLGIAYAGKDRRNSLVAADCYQATMKVMANAEAVERFQFLPDADACEMEYWPLERRKIEEGARARKDLDGKVAVVIGAASGIGRATALRFAAEGAHLLLADRDTTTANALATEINMGTAERAFSLGLDVADDAAVGNVMEAAVLRFGGIDILFYSPGVAPELHSVADMPDSEIERQMRVHYQGAVAATREAARVMLAQGMGGRLVYNASKAAFAPGEGAAAYGASKAALVHYVRNAANELGRHGITANYINADAVDTPLFRAIARQRAKSRGETEEQTLVRYAERSVLRQALVPPEAVAEAAMWLASGRSAYTTGCVITVGGGAEGFPR